MSEAALVCTILEAFVGLGVDPSQIGVISPYKAQLTAIRNMLNASAHATATTATKAAATNHSSTTSAAAPASAAATSAAATPLASASSRALLVESATVDRFQGRDKDMILLSLVRSNPEGHVGQLLQDWRRINVAVTRAKSKLVLLGNSNTLKQAPLLAALLDYFAFRHQRLWYHRRDSNPHRTR